MIHTRKILLLFFSFLFFINFSNGQIIEISGQVFVQNSRDQNGKVKTVKNVKIKSPYSKTVSTDTKGRFNLKLVNPKMDETIFFQVSKSGYEVIDLPNLKYTLMDKKDKLRIFIAPKGYMQKARFELTTSAKNALTTERERLLDLLAFGGKATDAAIRTINSRTGMKVYTAYDAEELLLQMHDDVEKNISLSAYELAIVNPDFASDDFLVAKSHYIQGDILEAVAILQDEIDEDKSIGDILSLIERNDDSAAIDNLLSTRALKIEQIKNNLMLQSIALHQNFRFKESNEVLVDLSNINTVAPTHKFSQFIERFDFYNITNPEVQEETPFVSNDSQTTPAKKTDSDNVNTLLEEKVKVTPPQKIASSDKEEMVKEEAIKKKNKIEYKTNPTKKIATTDVAIKNEGKQIENIIDNPSDSVNKIGTTTKTESIASSTTNNNVTNESAPTSYDILSSKGNNVESDKLTTTVTQVGESAPTIQPKETVATTTAAAPFSMSGAALSDFESILFFTKKTTAQWNSFIENEKTNDVVKTITKTASTSASTSINTTTSTPPQPSTSSTTTNNSEWVIVDYQPQTNSTSMIVEKTEPVVFEDNSIVVNDYRPIPAIKKTNTSKKVRSSISVPSTSRYAITKRTSLRKSPTAKSKVLKRLAVGTEMVIIEYVDKYWCKVILNGREGYVKSFLLEEAD